MERFVTKRAEMTAKHNMTAPKMTRVTVRVPKTTLDQINDWVDTLGVRRSHFLGIALVAGVRALIRASALMPDASTMPLAPETDVQPSADSAPEKPLDGVENVPQADRAAFVQTIEALQSEVASLQSQVTELKDHLQARWVPAKKRS